MQTSLRLVASCLIAGMVLSACGGGNSGGGILPAGSPTQSTGSSPAQGPISSVPKTAGTLAYTDMGAASQTTPVNVTLTLNYNHQAQLDQLVAQQADPTSPMYHHYLTTDEFNSYYAPTAQQEQSVVFALQRAGFTITKEYSNRTIIEASAPAAKVESYFNTQIHMVNQGKFGARYVNVKPAVVPAAISSLVHAVTTSNVIVARTGAHVRSAESLSSLIASTTLPSVPHVPAQRASRTLSLSPQVKERAAMSAQYETPFSTSNAIGNPGFETGAFSPWFPCDNGYATIDSSNPHSGRYDAFTGNLANNLGEEYGLDGVCQEVTVPSKGQLSFYVDEGTSETSTYWADQEADLFDANGNYLTNLYTENGNTNGYVHRSYNIGAYAGQKVIVFVGIYGSGSFSDYNYVYLDDVSLTGGSSPTPSPSPTPKPTASPTPKPTNSPTPRPTNSPTPVPTNSPTPVPTPTPVAGGTCNGSPDNGPVSGSNGWLATGVAEAFDYPVQHGCNGAGVTVAVEIDTPINTSDVAGYLSAAGVTQTGTITNEAVSGGGNASSSDYTETALDVETISGLAPGANIIVYNFPDLSSQSIEAGYNQTVSDGKATVVNSSFGGCETSDTAFTNTTNTIAEQAAAKGMTFVASSGDSGSDECGTGNNPPGVSSPATDPYFTAVGAVNFTDTSSGALASITSGSDSSNGFLSGGGVSTIFALPSYQQGVANMVSTGRNDPDVSLPGVGVMVYANGSQMQVDGTSWSSPEFVALMAEANQLHGSPLGFVNPTLYSIFTKTGYTDFTDVTTGNNGAYNAGTGYDLVTGIGAPKGWALANAL